MDYLQIEKYRLAFFLEKYVVIQKYQNPNRTKVQLQLLLLLFNHKQGEQLKEPALKTNTNIKASLKVWFGLVGLVWFGGFGLVGLVWFSGFGLV